MSGSPKRPKARLRLETETARPCSSSKSSRCSSSVRSGLRKTWAGRAASSARPLCAGGPEGGLASTPPVSRRSLSQRLMVGSETPKVSAISLRGDPRSTAASTLILRSFEYGFMPQVSHADQPTRKPLYWYVMVRTGRPPQANS